MLLIAVATAAILLALSVLHLLWALQVWWPIRDEVQLARAVAGFPGISQMPPPLACFFVAGALGVLAVSAMADVFAPAPPMLAWLATAGGALVFLARGAVGFTPYWARATPEQPFRTLDRRYYSPLCLGLGALQALLVFSA